jgi:TatD DNase family protein
MLIDSHCHLNFLDLSEFNYSMDEVIAKAESNGVRHFLSVCVELDDYPELCRIADQYSNVSISVGVHPDNDVKQEPDAAQLVALATSHPACIAIGETGLDYYRVTCEEGQERQRTRFREHIRAAITTAKPLIIHTRQAAEDTLTVMREENASQIGGVMHCFTENLDIARRAMEMNFYISLSGILTFKNATVIQEVAREVPLDRLLIETDSPYLAPVPFRGKQNHPALVREVALKLSELRQVSFDEIAEQTSENFRRCFRLDSLMPVKP